MLRLSRPRVTYANVVSSLALFIALGGTSYAVAKLPKNSVGESQLRASAVTSSKIKDGTIAPGDLAPGAASSGPRGPRGEQGPKGTDGARGPSNAYFAKMAAALELPANAEVRAQVARIPEVPAGDYLAILTADASLRVAGAGMHVACELSANGQAVGAFSGIVGDALGGAEVMGETMTVRRKVPFDATLWCWTNIATAGLPARAYVHDATIALIRVDSLSTP